MRSRLTAVTPYMVPAAATAAFFVAARIAPALRDSVRVDALIAAFIVGCVAIAVAATLSAKPALLSALHSAFSPLLLFASGYGVFLLVERDLTRLAIAVVSVGLLAAYFASVVGLRDNIPRYGAEDRRHLAFALQVVGCFFFLSFFFTIPAFSGLHPSICALAVAVLSGIIVWDACYMERMAKEQSAHLALAFAVLAGECFAVLAFLPVMPYVNAAIALTLFVTALSVAMASYKGVRLQVRQILFALVLAGLVLATARWT